MTAMSTASQITSDGSLPSTIASTTRPASSGVATASTASTIPTKTKATIRRRWGRAKASTRRTVSRENGRRSSRACMALDSADHAVISMLMPGLLPPRDVRPAFSGADARSLRFSSAACGAR